MSRQYTLVSWLTALLKNLLNHQWLFNHFRWNVSIFLCESATLQSNYILNCLQPPTNQYNIEYVLLDCHLMREHFTLFEMLFPPPNTITFKGQMLTKKLKKTCCLAISYVIQEEMHAAFKIQIRFWMCPAWRWVKCQGKSESSNGFPPSVRVWWWVWCSIGVFWAHGFRECFNNHLISNNMIFVRVVCKLYHQIQSILSIWIRWNSIRAETCVDSGNYHNV